MQKKHDSKLARKSTLVSTSCMLEVRYSPEPAHVLPREAMNGKFVNEAAFELEEGSTEKQKRTLYPRNRNFLFFCSS